MNLTDCLFWGRIYSQTTQEYYFHRKGVALYGGNFYAPGQESKFRCKSFVLTSSECKFLGTIQPQAMQATQSRGKMLPKPEPLPYFSF